MFSYARCLCVTGNSCRESCNTSVAAPQAWVKTGVPTALASANTSPKVSGRTKFGMNTHKAERTSS